MFIKAARALPCVQLHFEIDLRQRFTQKAEDNMGNSNAKVVNDTEEPIHLYVFDYADGLRWWPREEFTLKPHHTHDVKALAHMSGTIIATSTGKRGHHLEVANGATLNVSDLLKAPHNRWYKSCHTFLCGGILLTFVLVW